MASRGNRTKKVKRIFQQFDMNKDGGLNREEMASLVLAVNPRVKFSQEQINAILDEVFKTYSEFINGQKGLTFDGLLRTYDDGAGDVDRDFQSLGFQLNPESSVPISLISDEAQASSSSVIDDRIVEQNKNQASPNHGIAKIVDELENLIKRLKAKQAKDGRLKGDNIDIYSDVGWSRELGPSSEISERRIIWEESGSDFTSFLRELGVLRNRVDGTRSREEAFDGHMAIARVLYEHQLFKEALISFKRSSELQPTDVRAHFRAGNCLYVNGKRKEAKEEFLLALEAAEVGGNQWSYLLPQIHVNLGISLESEGMVLSACENYREAAILCPTHFRALKLLGSALFGVGEYRAAEKALEEAIFLKIDYADAHCDLGSTLHAMGEHDKAIQEFQKAIDLKPGHVDALYNLGGLYMDMGRYQRASDMYTRVLAVFPNNWRAQLNKAVALFGAGESEEAKKALKEAFNMTNRVELHDAITHLKQLQKKRPKPNGGTDGAGSFHVVETSKFKRVDTRTTLRQDLASALEIRSFQRLTRLSRCEAELLKKEMDETEIPVSFSGNGVPEKSIRKAALEVILRRLLHFLKSETFQGAVKVINERILSVLDVSGGGRIDLGMFFAILAPICGGSSEQRKRTAFDALMWRPVNEEGNGHIKRIDALNYIKWLRAVYIPSQGAAEMMEVRGEEDNVLLISFPEFVLMFDDPDWGFGIMTTFEKLENKDRTRHGHHSCSVCRYPITGSRFKEIKSHFSLCNQCYSAGKVPSSFKQEEYNFKEYETEREAVKDKCLFFNLHSKNSSQNDS